MIHLPSLGFSEGQRQGLSKPQVRENSQMARLCDLADPLVEVLYVAPFALPEVCTFSLPPNYQPPPPPPPGEPPPPAPPHCGPILALQHGTSLPLLQPPSLHLETALPCCCKPPDRRHHCTAITATCYVQTPLCPPLPSLRLCPASSLQITCCCDSHDPHAAIQAGKMSTCKSILLLPVYMCY